MNKYIDNIYSFRKDITNMSESRKATNHTVSSISCAYHSFIVHLSIRKVSVTSCTGGVVDNWHPGFLQNFSIGGTV